MSGSCQRALSHHLRPPKPATTMVEAKPGEALMHLSTSPCMSCTVVHAPPPHLASLR